jgi:hypothetical protein
MPSSAAQLPRQRGGRCRHHGAVIGCPAPQTLHPQRGLGRRAGAAVVVAVRGCPDAGPAVRRCVRRADVRPPGRADLQCPGDRCPPERCDRSVRTDRHPGQTGVRGSAASASTLSGPRWIPDLGAAGQATSGGPGSTGRCGLRAAWSSLPESGLAGKRWSNVGRAWLARGSTAHLGCRFAGAPAGATRSPPGRGSWSSVRVPVGWLGAREGAGAPKSPAGASWAGCRRDARPWG